MEFNLNCKKFDKKYLNDIKLEILKFYNVKYQNVEIKYRKSKLIYTFSVYVNLDVVNDKIWCQEKVLIKTYSNIEAVENFVPTLKDEYYEEYDDNRKDYLQKFVDEMESIVVLYKTLGMDLTIDYNESPKEYDITYKTNSLTKFFSNKYINIRCNYEGMMTKEEYRKNICCLKNTLSRYYDKYNS